MLNRDLWNAAAAVGIISGSAEMTRYAGVRGTISSTWTTFRPPPTRIVHVSQHHLTHCIVIVIVIIIIIIIIIIIF